MKDIRHLLLTIAALSIAGMVAWSCSSKDEKKSDDKGDSAPAGDDGESDTSGEEEPLTAEVCRTMRYRPVEDAGTCRYSFKEPSDCAAAEGAFPSLKKCRDSLGLESLDRTFTPAADHTSIEVGSIHLTRTLDCFDSPLDEWRFEFIKGDTTLRFELSGEILLGETIAADSPDLTISRVDTVDGEEKTSVVDSGEIRIDSLESANITMTVKADMGGNGVFSGTSAGAYYLVPDSLCPDE